MSRCIARRARFAYADIVRDHRSEPRDDRRAAAIAFLAVVVPVGIGLTIYWAVVTRFPAITAGGWLLVGGYLSLTVAVPTVLTPYASRTFHSGSLTWRLIALVWVSITAITGLLAWPAIGSYIEPFFGPPAR
jgi:hypothetical protein